MNLIAGFSLSAVESVVFEYLPDLPVIVATMHVGMFERDFLAMNYQGKFQLRARKAFRFDPVQKRHCLEPNIIRLRTELTEYRGVRDFRMERIRGIDNPSNTGREQIIRRLVAVLATHFP